MSSMAGAVEGEEGNREVSPIEVLGGAEANLEKKGARGGNLVSPTGANRR